MFYSRGISIRRFPSALRELRKRQAGERGAGEISSVQALFSAIAATVGMGNIAGVAMAIWIGGPGAIFWMWVSALVGMTTKFFEGTLSVMYKGEDDMGIPQGGPMYIIGKALGTRWKPLATAFAVFGLVGTLCLTQANQLVESVTTVFAVPGTFNFKMLMGVVMAVIVGFVILGGINRIASLASRVVPMMVILYLILVVVISVVNYERIPVTFAAIFKGAFDLRAGLGGLAGVALIGARRAALVNEAGIGTASMMHGASANTKPVREGLIAMIEPLIDSGIVCTITSIPIIMYLYPSGYHELASYSTEGVKGLYVALNAFESLIPYGKYLLMTIVFFFAFSTMFSYSYYGQKCTTYLFGSRYVIFYNIYYLVMIVVAAIISLDTMVAIMDVAFLLMACCTMTMILRLAPRVMEQAREYFKK